MNGRGRGGYSVIFRNVTEGRNKPLVARRRKIQTNPPHPFVPQPGQTTIPRINSSNMTVPLNGDDTDFEEWEDISHDNYDDNSGESECEGDEMISLVRKTKPNQYSESKTGTSIESSRQKKNTFYEDKTHEDNISKCERFVSPKTIKAESDTSSDNNYLQQISVLVNSKAQTEFCMIREKIENINKVIFAKESHIKYTEKSIEFDHENIKQYEKDKAKVSSHISDVSKQTFKTQEEIKEMTMKLDQKKLQVKRLLLEKAVKEKEVAAKDLFISHIWEGQRQKYLLIVDDKHAIKTNKEKITTMLSVKTYEKQADPFLQHLDKKIDKKHEDLECPVCFCPASPPIYRCGEYHLICAQCRPKMRICGECRVPYNGLMRHRFAEKIHEELEELEKTRTEHLKT